jgi:ABC-type lipoprotein export system ATPase subunit
MDGAVLTARDLWKSYDGRTDVLRGAALEVLPAEAVVVWGDNGSGKTTLLSLLGGLDAPDRGSVSVEGNEITGLRENALARVRLLQLGFVFQTHHLIEDLTVEENLALPLRLAKRPADARVRELQEAFGLTKLALRKPSEISVGESQRVAVARALANGPKVLLADEPTASLDAKGTAAVLDALRLARTRFGTAEIIATHDPEVQAVATSQYVLDQGVLRPRT